MFAGQIREITKEINSLNFTILEIFFDEDEITSVTGK
jgi:hypothetical protein